MSVCFPQVCRSLEKILAPRLISAPPDIEALRLYVTLPECPLLHNPSNYASLTIPLASATVSLKEAAHTVLCEWMAWSSPLLSSSVCSVSVGLQCIFGSVLCWYLN